MCGIAGFAGFVNNQELAFNANRLQSHRGPDSQSIWHDDNLALAHQRLSIIDLSERSNQPLEKGDFVIVYNGELYNYKEIRDLLQKQKGSIFLTESDTEVVLESFIQFGSDCLGLFIGMFAFAIYNKKSSELFLARDHFGIKPLYYFIGQNGFAFSSELKSLMQIPKIRKDLNYSSLVASINLLWIPGDESIFSEINKLPPAHFLKFKNGSIETILPYWQLPADQEVYSENEYIELLDIEFNKAIDRHMVSDVNVSAFLSGGLDSSLISVMAQKRVSHNLKTYTIAINGRDKKVEQMGNDAYFARQLAKQFGFNHTEILIDTRIVDNLPKIISHLEEPVGDPAAINTMLICDELKKQGDRVILSGMGADELFLGYRRQKATLISMKYKKIVPQWLHNSIDSLFHHLPVKVGGRGVLPVRWAKRFLSMSNGTPSDIYFRSYSYYNKTNLDNLFTKDVKSVIEGLYKYHGDIFEQYNNDLINRICYTDVKMFMNGLNLFYSDKSSMASSVEVRVPFIDKKIVELAFRVKGDLKIKNGTSKYLLKKVAEKYLPNDIIYRKKASFGVPIRSWISHDLRPMINEYLSERSIKARGIFSYSEVKKMIDLDSKGQFDYAYQIYQLLTFEIFARTFIDND